MILKIRTFIFLPLVHVTPMENPLHRPYRFPVFPVHKHNSRTTQQPNNTTAKQHNSQPAHQPKNIADN
jgi:hypothetical protein